MKLLKKLKQLFHNGKEETLSKPISSITALFLLVAWITQSDELLHLIDITIYEIIALSQLSSNISILPLVLSLCALIYASLLSFSGKNKSYYTEYIGVYWKSVKLKDGSNMFHVEASPYCIFHKIKLESINTIAKTNKILKMLKNIPSKEIEKNKKLYQQLVTLNPSNAKYKSKLKLYSNKVNYAKRNPFKEKDFYFDKKTKGYKKIIIAGVNQVYRENSRCKNIEPSSAYISSSKGSRSNPVFYVTCGKGNGVFNVFFSKSDIEKGKRFSAKKHINKSKATRICEGYAKSHANHPSSVNFSTLIDLSVYETPNGRTRVTSSFTAKNSFNLELKYKISCLLDSNGLIEGNISEAR